ncbi:BA14K family protein [Aquamicrobium segne]|uniref:Lectin-like protein BA14k n=1 Tax=Aquamicrobium segne TaxID=469547 RepID=A0ABW0GV81_9HYPH
MKRIVTSLLASVVSLSFVVADVALVSAAPINIAPVQQVQTSLDDVQLVQSRSERRLRPRYKRQHRRHVNRNEFRRHSNGNVYWRGHRGYRHHRPGYRRHGDFWFPLAAFATGAIIGGALSNSAPPPAYRGGNAHVEWCYGRYRSYRASDNTFQPYNGPRKQCISPYY